MARFDVYANPDPADRDIVPFFLDVQNDFLGILETRAVVPLHTAARFDARVRNLNPEFKIANRTVVMDTASIGAIPLGALRKPVASLASRQLDIQDALDTLFGSY